MANTFKPNDRYAFVAKTRAGKTSLATVLAGTLAMSLMNTDWEVWVLETKGDPNDLVAWREWGFRNYASQRDQQTSLVDNAFYFRIDSKDARGNDLDVVAQSQAIINAAYLQGKRVVVVDEYVSIVPSSRSAGKPLLDVFQRGGGRNVGLIGLTQEPVYVPRQLLSQATHIFLFSLSYEYDIKWARGICPEYVPPSEQGYPYGFYYKWVDGPVNKWTFFRHQKDWYKQLNVALPRPPVVENNPDAMVTTVW